jgi:hypothetical protein
MEVGKKRIRRSEEDESIYIYLHIYVYESIMKP